MACTIDSTVGGETSNSYASIVEADAYHETHLYAAAWVNATEDQKCRALQMATRILDAEYNWYGIAASKIQALAWPRVGVFDREGVLYDDDEIPKDLKSGVFDMARNLLVGDRTADSEVETQGIEQIVAGPIELRFRASVRAKVIPDSVVAWLRYLGTKNKQRGVVTLVRT